MTPEIGRIGALILLFPLSFGLTRLVVFSLRKYVRSRDPSGATSVDPALYLNKRLYVLFFVLGLSALVPLLHLPPNDEAYTHRLLWIADIFIATWTLNRVITFIKAVVFSRMRIDLTDNLRARKIRTQLQFIEKIILLFVYVVAGALILMNFEIARKLGGSLIASAGLAGIVIGFAAQKSLGNLVAGFQIAFTQPIRIDDVVIVENEWGRIDEITFTYVSIKLWDRRSLVVPITYFLEKPFQNWTRSSADLIATTFLYVDYTMPIDKLREEYKTILASTSLWDQKLTAVQVTDCNAVSIEVRFLAGARNAQEAFDLRCIIREKLVNFVQEKYPQCLPVKRYAREDLTGEVTKGLDG